MVRNRDTGLIACQMRPAQVATHKLSQTCGETRGVVRFAVNVPNFGDYASPDVVVALAADAEAAGWDGFFVWDHLLIERTWEMEFADPWILLTALAVATERIRIGPMVTPLPRRRPWLVARQAVTLDHLSGGRLTLGVGLGHPPEVEYGAFGEDADVAVHARKLDEALQILDGLWGGGPFTFHGEWYQLEEVRFLPRPIQQPRIPIWVGGYWPRRAPFRRMARWDGMAPGRLEASMDDPIPPEELVEALAYVRAHRPRDPAPFDVCVGGVLPPDAGAARDVIARYEAAGATWWSENVHGLRGSVSEMQALVRRGPPTASRLEELAP